MNDRPGTARRAGCYARRSDMAEVQHADGRVELDDATTREIESSPLYNHDLAPVRVADRKWTTYNYAALWISMAHCIPTYMLASSLMRALVACGWFGINAWIGGQALHIFFKSVFPGWGSLGPSLDGHLLGEWISFALFWLLNIWVVYRGMDLLRRVENWAAPFVLIMTALLLGWAIWRAHGLGTIMSQPGKFTDFGSFFKVFIPSLTAMI